MSQSNLEILPIRFDPYQFAEQRTELNGLVAVKSMQRLLGQVLSAVPMATVNLAFSRGQNNYPQVSGALKLEVELRCERCLEQFTTSLVPAINLLIKPASEYISETREGPEIYEYDGKSLTLSDLIEEELLLALPLVPRHEDISLCNQDMVAWLATKGGSKASGENSDDDHRATGEKSDNPFAILKR